MSMHTKPPRTDRRNLARLAGAAALALAGVGNVGAQTTDNYPAKPIRMIVPYPAGGGTDIIGRLVGQELNKRWGQSVVVENRPGASGTIGYGMVAKAPADGYTVLLGITTLIQTPWLYKNLSYKLSDLTPVSQIARSADILIAPRSSGITTLQQFVEKAKANPGALSYATYGNASTSHFNGERFKKEAGIDVIHVPFQGASPAMAAVLGAEDTLVERICSEVSGTEIVVPANYNAPGQIVIGGHTAAVERALSELAQNGVRKAVKLAVSVPSHTPLMREAANRLKDAIAALDWRMPKLPVIHNVDAAVHHDLPAICDALVRQLYLPVRWSDCVNTLAANGVTRMAECGPGKVLAGLAKRINKSIEARALGSLNEFESTRTDWA